MTLDPAVQSILEAEDERIFEILDEVANRGHKMSVAADRPDMDVCSRCGFRMRNTRRRKKPVPECPVAIVEKIMES